MALVEATPGGDLREKDRRRFLVPEAEYEYGPGIRFAIDLERHAEVGFQGTSGIGKTAASEPTATGARMAALMRTFGSGAPAAEPANEPGQARPWSEILAKLGYAKPAGSAGGATCEVHKSTTRTASSPARPEPEQSTPAGTALPWKTILARLESEERAK
jgi:hypothetical protein